MKFSLNFIKEFFDPERPAAEIARLLTMAGLEVGSVRKKGGDYVFEAEITSNRYDWLSIFGLAVEVAAVLNQRFKLPSAKNEREPLLISPRIKVAGRGDCPLYTARLVRGVKVSDSPLWLKEKITLCGGNVVNNVVDITNYCMLKWGNPLHAFDFDKIQGDIHIRRAKEGEQFLGLDNKERVLSPVNLVISDDFKIIALAGVIGAKNSEVGPTTTNILLEGAVFSPIVIRRSQRAAGVQTDSSYRFERNVSPDLLAMASYEAAKMIRQLSGGRLAGYKKAGVSKKAGRNKIVFSLEDLNSYIGIGFPKKEVRAILNNLGFAVKQRANNKFSVQTPFFRLDIARDVDIFEEVARIYGYDRIGENFPKLNPRSIGDHTYVFKKKLRDFIVDLGLNEIITYSLTGRETLAKLNQSEFIPLTNPLRSQEDALRTTLLTGMIEAAKHNLNQRNQDVRFFEIANIYKRQKGKVIEFPAIAGGVNSNGGGFFYLKGVVEEILKFLSITGYRFVDKRRDNFISSSEILCEKETLGFIGKLAGAVKREWDIKDDLYFFEIDMGKMIRFKKNIFYIPFSKYPAISRDISLGLKKTVAFSRVKDILEETVGEYLFNYSLLDIYKGKGSSQDSLLCTVRVSYNSREKTLTALEVDEIHTRLRERLSNTQGIILR
ncbi:MAG: phenylalanine--tRNA ligase subunit beta [Candidatus Omnitrophota bacterium]